MRKKGNSQHESPFKQFIFTAVSVFTILVFFSSAAFATNGYFRHGYGTHYRSMAGAGVALHLSSLGAATNPASMAFIGPRYDIGFSLFNPNREYTVAGTPSGFPGTFGLINQKVESDSKIFFIPSLGANWVFGEVNSVGVSIFGNGGMNTDYDEAVFYGTAPTGVNLSQLFIAPTFARKLSDEHALGITPILAYQMFEGKGFQAFAGFSEDGANISNNGTASSFGYGARIGYLGKLMPALSVGASYQTRIFMGEFDDYAGLFAEQGGFDIPANWVAGIAVTPSEGWTVALDVQQVLYSGINSVGNPFNPAEISPVLPDGVTPNPDFKPLGSKNGSGFGWDDMLTVKLGLQWETNEDWTLRAGFSHGEQPIPKNDVLFNIVAPGVISQHITFGFSRKIGETQELSFAFMHALSNSVKGANQLDAPDQQTIELKMNQFEFDISYAFGL